MSFRSPLHDLERGRGARFITCSSWEIAQEYKGARVEYEAVRQEVGMLDLCHLGKLSVTGRDRARYLHNMLSNDIKSLSPGTGCYATLLTRQGQMESDLHVYALSDELRIECPAPGTDRCFETLKKFIIGDVVQIEDWSQKLAILSLQGPMSRETMEHFTGASLADLPMLAHKTVERSPGNWLIVHHDRTGCDGYDLWLPGEEAADAWSRWQNSNSVELVGGQAFDWLRTEAGIPWFGVDMETRNLPMEFGLDSAISMNKGCYRGQEIVARVVHRGHLDRHLGAIAVNHAELPVRGAEIRARGAKVGEVTSAILSPRLGRPLALALLKTEFLHPGTAVEILYGENAHLAEVVSLPLS